MLPINLWGDFSFDFAVLIHEGDGLYLFEGKMAPIFDFVQKQIKREFNSQKSGLDVVFLKELLLFHLLPKLH